ncbi:MAG: glycoside hydrolase family 2 protein, partial [Muricoprocola sp.]
MRTCRDLNDSWYFTKNSFGEVPETVSEQWEKISLPHTWNALDGQDGGSDYYRGPCWYMRKIEVSDQELDKEIYLEIGAASSFCEVYVNGEKAGEHAGGYSLFRMNITDMLRAGNNVFSIMVSNEAQDDIYPQMADFTFYGGLYRYVKLLTVEKSHFDLDYYGGSGVQIDSKITKPGCAILHMRSFLCAPREGDRILYTVYDGEHQEIAQAECPARKQTEVRLFLTDLRLWQGVEDPYLYQIEVSLVRHNDVIDQVQVRHGFREFHVDPQKGFYLNDVLTPLRGVSRHQDKLGVGNALTREDHLLDAELIRELGANTIRLAHYQHSQDFYDICDEMGFIVWAEIPFISRMNSCSQAHQNCISQMKELIIQNYNHSSIVVWGISNEITIGGSVPGLTENLKELNELVHSLDSTRLSTMAQVSTLPMEDEQNEITDILSYNHYFGWYQGSFTDNEKWLDTFHAMHPDRALGLSEYGCEGIITYHNDSPKAGDYSEEYQALYHEHMAKIIEERPWLWATHIWNMFDFGCDARDEG